MRLMPKPVEPSSAVSRTIGGRTVTPCTPMRELTPAARGRVPSSRAYSILTMRVESATLRLRQLAVDRVVHVALGGLGVLVSGHRGHVLRHHHRLDLLEARRPGGSR